MAVLMRRREDILLRSATRPSGDRQGPPGRDPRGTRRIGYCGLVAPAAAAILTALLCINPGCRWGLADLRAHTAAAQYAQATAILALAEEIPAVPIREAIRIAALDVAERAAVEVQDHTGSATIPPVVVGSREDAAKANAHAGAVAARTARHVAWQKLPRRLAAGASGVVSEIAEALLPAWFRLGLAVLAAGICLSAAGRVIHWTLSRRRIE